MAFYPLRAIRAIAGYVSRRDGPRLRVLSYHDMSEADYPRFTRQLRWIQKRWDIVDPKSFAGIIERERPLERDTLLLTFDDGTVSNLHVAEHVLLPLGIHALFFVVAHYSLLTDSDDWREFAAKRIALTDDREALPENFRNMSIADLKSLLRLGHTVGAHTLTHARLSELSGAALRHEIVDGGDLLEQHLSTPIEHFAYPFGDFRSLSAEASGIARARFKYVYTALRGDNGGDKLPWHLRRDSNDPHDSLWYTGACLEGGADFLYRRKYVASRDWPVTD